MALASVTLITVQNFPEIETFYPDVSHTTVRKRKDNKHRVKAKIVLAPFIDRQ